MIAQDLLDIIPEVITKSELIGETREWFEENYEGAEPYRYGVDYSKLTLNTYKFSKRIRGKSTRT